MAKVHGICISEKRGTEKTLVNEVNLIEDWGLENDAHAGHWHRQVSLLGLEKIEDFKKRGGDVEFGAFGENLIIDGFDFRNLPVTTRLQIGEVILEISQIGKECHNHCRIYHQVGDCIMPREGVFAKVIKGGHIKIGDEVVLLPYQCKQFRAGVITLSDKGSAGLREDLSGKAICQRLKEAGYLIEEYFILPDNKMRLKKELIRLADARALDLILTTGGTGLSMRDNTPEATLEVATKNVPGISEALRGYSLQFTSRAILSRGVSVIRNKTLIINLPGSLKAVNENLDFLMEPLSHGLQILKGEAHDCAR